MKTIYKYPIGPVSAQEPFEIEMPEGAQILTVQRQGLGEDAETCIWALVDIYANIEMRRFMLCGTGREVPGPTITAAEMRIPTYIDTFQLMDGALVWHLFTL